MQTEVAGQLGGLRPGGNAADPGGLVAAAVRHTGRRLVWFLILLYGLAVLDRINVGFAAVTMNRRLGLTPSMFGFGASMFLVGYLVLEVPSNLMLVRYGPRRWLARIALTWGIATCLMALVQGPASFYAMRFIVGAAEAGCLPGILFFLTRWFPQAYRARFNALFLASIPLTNACSAPVSTAIMSLDGAAGLAGWQWLFIVEGLASAMMGVMALSFLVDRPTDAAWLPPAQRHALQYQLDCERDRVVSGPGGRASWRPLLSPTVLLLSISYIGINLQLNTAAFWFPQVFKSLFMSSQAVAVATSTPFLAGALAMYAWGGYSDRSGRRVANIVAAIVVSAVGWAVAGLTGSAAAMVIALSVAMAGGFSAMTIFWTLPPRLLMGSASAAGIAMISAIGTLGSAGAATIVGVLRQGRADFGSSFLFVAAVVLVCPAILLALRSRLA
jgi:MFS family permease